MLPMLQPPHQFYVLEHEGQIVACGGFQIASPNTVELREYMVHPGWRRQGLGRFLIFYLLKQIADLGTIEQVYVEAPPEAGGFFEKQGFHRLGPLQFSKKLTVCA